MVQRPFADNAQFDWELLSEISKFGGLFLDSVIDLAGLEWLPILAILILRRIYRYRRRAVFDSLRVQKCARIGSF